MKKSTGILLLLSFIVVMLILVGVFVTLIVYLVQGSTPNLLHSSRIALVRVEGVIFDSADWIDQIEDYQEDDSVKAIVLRIDSPGGGVGPSQELYDAVLEARKTYGKTVVASFASVAASGGYYIAAGADYIVSSPGCLTGSIGVYAQFLQAQDLMEKIGVDYNTVKAGKYKTAGSFEREMTDYEREMFQSVIDDTYSQFVEAVIHGRRKELQKLLVDWTSSSHGSTYPFTPEVVQVIQDYQTRRRDYLATHPDKAAQASGSIGAATAVVETGTDSVAAGTDSVSAGTDEVASVTQDENPYEEDLDEGTTEDDLESEEQDVFPADEKTLTALAKALAEGKIYTGRQARTIALVDDIGTLEDAVDVAAQLTGIRGEPTLIERKEREMTLFDLLTEKVSALTEQKASSPLLYKFPY